MGSHVLDEFFKSSQEVSAQEREVLRQNYFIAAKMRGNDEQAIAGLNINTSGRHNSTAVDIKEQ